MQKKIKNREALLSHGDIDGRKIDLDITEKTLQHLDAYERIKSILGRRPTSGELAMYSVMWSEHCSYKSSKVHLKKFGTLSQDTLSAFPLFRLVMVLRFTGRLAFPLFCFLLVEGFVHTHNVKGYLGRLVLFGLLSEVPFDLAFFRTPFAPQHQNVYWTLALGVLAMAGLKRFEKENGLPGWQGLVWAGGCAALALAANTDYHAICVLIICTLYLTRADRKRQCLAGALLFLFELTAPLAFVLVWFYNGQRGACSPLQKKAFYWFYPVNLLVLAGITNLLL